MTKVKVFCIQSIEEAQLAIEYGAFAIGLVSKMPSGPGVISDEKIKKIANWAKGKIKSVLLTALQDADELIEQYRFFGTDIIQLVDSQESSIYQKLRIELPEVKLMQVIHVIDKKSIEEAIEVSKHVDYILLDSGNPNLETKVLGGTAETHNWKISKQIVDGVSVPVFLAGGLNPDNVADAIVKVYPFGVDLCSGLRVEGKLVDEKINSFMVNILR